MAHPAWVGEGFAAALVVVGGYCLSRLVAVVPLGRQTHVDVNVGHVLMAVAMVGMLVPRWRVFPTDVWATVFLLAGLWFLGRASLVAARVGVARLLGPDGLHARHYAVHGVMALSMVYMDAVAGRAVPGGGSTMGASTGVPALTLLFMVVLLASAAWQLNGMDRLVPAPSAIAAPGAIAASGALAASGASSGVAAPACVGESTAAPLGGGLSAASKAPVERPWLAPRLEVGCHIAMCLAMAYMLVLVV